MTARYRRFRAHRLKFDPFPHPNRIDAAAGIYRGAA
jgi:hypothetical protein